MNYTKISIPVLKNWDAVLNTFNLKLNDYCSICNMLPFKIRVCKENTCLLQQDHVKPHAVILKHKGGTEVLSSLNHISSNDLKKKKIF